MKCTSIFYSFIFLLLHTSGYSQNFVQTKKLIAGQNMEFGKSIFISKDFAIVGSIEDDEFGNLSGAAYIFAKNAGGSHNWGLVKKITANDPTASAYFGQSVSISGDIAVVGATGSDSFPSFSGGVYVYGKDVGGIDNWGQIKKLTDGNSSASDMFGQSVSNNGDLIIVGAHNPGFTGGACDGSAYVFSKDEGGLNNWGLVKNITLSDCFTNIGYTVSISGNDAIIGTKLNINASLVNEPAFIFSKDEGGINNWGLVKELTASDHISFVTEDNFGRSVSIHGDIAIVGAAENDDAGNASGSAYIYSRNEGGINNWGEIKKITASDAAQDDQFGISVSVNDDVVIVGAIGDDDDGNLSGSAYIFSKNEGGINNWGEFNKITPNDGMSSDRFGHQVSLSQDFAMVGLFNVNNNHIEPAYIFESCLPLNLTCPVNVVLNADINSCVATGVNLGVAMFNCTSFSMSNDAPAEFPLGMTDVVWTVDNNYGTTDNCVQTVTIIENGISAGQCIYNCGTSTYISDADIDSGIVPSTVSMKQTIGSNAKLDPSEDFTFQAGQQIELDMGFEVSQTAVFHALIAPCN